MPPIVALDANVWFSQRMLRSALGASFLFGLRRWNGRIVLPSITRKETVARLGGFGEELVDRIKDGLGNIASITGASPLPPLPTRQSIDAAINARFDDLAPFIMPLEPMPADYEAAITRVIDKRVPNVKKEQFRDSLLLELLIRNVREPAVTLVTDDGDFFLDKNRGSIARDLASELKERGSSLTIVPSVEALLGTWGQSALVPDRDAILLALSVDLLFDMHQLATANGYEIGNIKTSDLNTFVTEDHRKLAVAFTIVWEAFSIPLPNGTVIPEGRLRVVGSAFYDLERNTAEDVVADSTELATLSGEVFSRGVTARIAGAHFGSRPVPYVLRAPLP